MRQTELFACFVSIYVFVVMVKEARNYSLIYSTLPSFFISDHSVNFGLQATDRLRQPPGFFFCLFTTTLRGKIPRPSLFSLVTVFVYFFDKYNYIKRIFPITEGRNRTYEFRAIKER